jgi:UDPglucose 6-dehydrogenase
MSAAAASAVPPGDSPGSTGLRLTVLGTGYLGATHAVCMALLGHEVLGVDVDRSKIETLSRGEVPFFEPGLEESLRKALSTGRLRFSVDFEEAAAFGDVHFVCVGTPQRAGSYAADLRHVEACVDSLAPHLYGPCLVVGKSTVPVGTADRLADRLSSTAPAGSDVHLAWNPEFLREGYAVEDTLHPDRLVFGISDPADEVRLREVYEVVVAEGTPVVVADLATSELVKVAANSFLATKISFINAMAELCEAVGADVTKLQSALSYDERIGGRFLQPGLGFGGGCLPKDIRAFMARAEELGVGQTVAFLREVDAINLRRRSRIVDLVRELAGGDLNGVRVAALGAAFKPDSDDVRDAPALAVAAALVREGAEVRVYDPKAMDNARRIQPDLCYTESIHEAVRDADIVCLLTEWGEFKAMDPVLLGTLVAQRHVVDGRHALDAEQWQTAGWSYRALGRRAEPVTSCPTV